MNILLIRGDYIQVDSLTNVDIKVPRDIFGGDLATEHSKWSDVSSLGATRPLWTSIHYYRYFVNT